jgi:hypothetical protein
MPFLLVCHSAVSRCGGRASPQGSPVRSGRASQSRGDAQSIHENPSATHCSRAHPWPPDHSACAVLQIVQDMRRSDAVLQSRQQQTRRRQGRDTLRGTVREKLAQIADRQPPERGRPARASDPDKREESEPQIATLRVPLQLLHLAGASGTINRWTVCSHNRNTYARTAIHSSLKHHIRGI